MPLELVRAEGARRHRGLPGDLQAGSARGHEPALGRQQHVARRAQPFGRDGRRRDARFRRSRLDRARRRLAARSAPAAEPLPARSDGGRAAAATSTCAPAPPVTAIKSAQGYVFKGERLGQVEPNAKLGDRSRTGSTPTPSASAPCSCPSSSRARPTSSRSSRRPTATPTLRSTGCGCARPISTTARCRPWRTCWSRRTSGRRRSFAASIRSIASRGGFVAPPCGSAPLPEGAFCFDTRRPGNGNGGHLYGTDLPANEKSDLLAYLLTF